MQKQKTQGDAVPDFTLLEEQGGTRRDFLRATAVAAASALMAKGAAIAQSIPPRATRRSAQSQRVFDGVFELEGGGELLIATLPDGTVRGSRGNGLVQLQGSVRNNTLVYRWWSPNREDADYRKAPADARGSGQATFKSPTEIAGEEKTEDGSSTKSWSAKSKPESQGILTVNRPFTGLWTNGRGDFLAFSQQPDGSLEGLHTPAQGHIARLRGYAREGRLEYRWWVPRNPADSYERTLLDMRGAGSLSATAEGKMQNEWASERSRQAKRTEFLERVKQAAQLPQAKNTVIPDLDDMTFLPFIRSHPKAVVDFWAPWCGPCKKIAPFFEQLSGQRPDVAFGRLNVDIGQQAKRALNVTGIPQIIFFMNGMEVHRVVGAKPDELARAFNAF